MHGGLAVTKAARRSSISVLPHRQWEPVVETTEAIPGGRHLGASVVIPIAVTTYIRKEWEVHDLNNKEVQILLVAKEER